MFELDHVLAQDIVDRAMLILPFNVNVMDCQGLIMGSGEPERINTRHEGAQLVLANQRVVEIDVQSAPCLKGVQPGINVPLTHDERLVGVLGLTGDPHTLRTYAELLRMTAEMLVSQRHREVQSQWRKQRSEDLLALLLGDAGDSLRLLDEAQQLGLKHQLMRTPLLIEFASKQVAAMVSEWLLRRVPDSWCLSPSPNTVLWCCPAINGVDPHKYLQKMQSQGWTPVRVAVGVPVQGMERLRKVCAHVTALAAYGRAVLKRQRLLLLTRLGLPAMLWAHREEYVIEELLAVVNKVRAKDSNGQLMQTLRSWCEHSGQIQICAEALGLHRNTLRYRMDRISEITQMDLTKLDDVMALYLGVQLMSDG